MEDTPQATTPSRKRPLRSLSPTPFFFMQSSQAAAASKDPQQFYSPQDLRLLEELRGDAAQRAAALNELLQLTASHEINYALRGDLLLNELVDIAIADCLQWTQEDDDSDDDDSQDDPVFRSQQTWLAPPTARMTAWVKHCHCQLDPKRSTLKPLQWQTLSVILVILRNLSFVGANLRLLAYSPNILALLNGCLYEGYDPCYDSSVDNNKGSMTLVLAALQTLVHLAPHLDVSGQKLLSDKLFYYYAPHGEGPAVPAANTFGLTLTGNWGFGAIWLAKRLDTKEDTVSDVDKEFILRLTARQLVGVWTVFSGITHILTDCKTPRSVLLQAMDLLQELINHARVGVVGSVQREENDKELPKLRAILVHMPDALLERLVDFLFVSRLGPDALDYVDPVHNIVTRVTTLKLLSPYDAVVDTDVRDRTLDVLVPLLELDSPRMAARLGLKPANSSSTQAVDTAAEPAAATTQMIRTRLYDVLVPILTTTAGRNEASILAAQLFRELALAPENRRLGLQYVQMQLVALAARNPRVSQLVWEHLYPATFAEYEDAIASAGRGRGGASAEDEPANGGDDDGDEEEEQDNDDDDLSS